MARVLASLENLTAYELKDGLRPSIKLKFLTKRIKIIEEVIDQARIAEEHWIKNKLEKEYSSKARDDQRHSKEQKEQSPKSTHSQDSQAPQQKDK